MSPITPSDMADAIPSANSDLCSKFSKWLNVPALLRDFLLWMLNSDGTLSNTFLAEVAAYSVPTGSLINSATQNMGDAWLLCDGSEVSRTEYAALFAVIGTRYGDGNTTTTFNLPDGRGRSLIGAGNGDGLTPRSINTVHVGEESHTQTVAEMPAHTHGWSGPEIRTEERGDGANNVWRGTLAATTDSAGGGQPFNVVHPCLVAYLFIKT